MLSSTKRKRLSFKQRFIGILCLICLTFAPNLLHAYYESDIERLFNWAESQYPSLFSPAATTTSLDVWKYRYYGDTGIYIGVNSDDEVYLMGGSFGGVQYVSTLCSLLKTISYSRGGQVITRVAAAPNQEAQGFPDGYIYWNVGTPGMGECGQIAFQGTADINFYSTNSNTNAVWFGYPGNLKVIAKENDTISGLASNILYDGGKYTGSAAIPPVITNSGNVALFADLKGAVTNATNGAILAWVDGTLKNVLRLGEAAPGFSKGTTVYQLHEFRFSDAGMVIFGSTSKNQTALWHWDYKTVNLLAAGMKSQFEDADEKAPFPVTECEYAYFGSQPAWGTDFFINDQGDIVVDVLLAPLNSQTDCPLYATLNMKNSSAKIITQADGNFPLNNGDFYARWTTKHLNTAGGITTRAVMGKSASSWYLTANNDPLLIVLSGEYVPPGYTQYIAYDIVYPYSVTNSYERSVLYGFALEGQNVEACILAGSPRISLPYVGTDQTGNSQLDLIAKLNMQPSSFPATSFFSKLGEPKLTENGDILFTATVESALDGSSIQSLWRVKKDNSMSCIFKTGQQIDVNGQQKTVESFYFDDKNYTSKGTGSGMPGLFSETGKLVLRCKTTGDSSYHIVTVSYE